MIGALRENLLHLSPVLVDLSGRHLADIGPSEVTSVVSAGYPLVIVRGPMSQAIAVALLVAGGCRSCCLLGVDIDLDPPRQMRMPAVTM